MPGAQLEAASQVRVVWHLIENHGAPLQLIQSAR
jgi:hypothetical protein